MTYKYLSHLLEEEIPVYGKRVCLGISQVKSISSGDSANSYRASIQSHWGTHIEGPNHFFSKGRKISQYPPETWFFKKPQAIRLKLSPSQVIRLGSWARGLKRDTDILLFQSGWSKLRDKKCYFSENPGIHPEVGAYLRKNTKVRAIGIDFISISPYQDRGLGRAAHRVFLDPGRQGQPIFIIEDMDLSRSLSKLKELFVFPLLVEGFDSSPCTIIGGFYD